MESLDKKKPLRKEKFKKNVFCCLSLGGENRTFSINESAKMIGIE